MYVVEEYNQSHQYCKYLVAHATKWYIYVSGGKKQRDHTQLTVVGN